MHRRRRFAPPLTTARTHILLTRNVFLTRRTAPGSIWTGECFKKSFFRSENPFFDNRAWKSKIEKKCLFYLDSTFCGVCSKKIEKNTFSGSQNHFSDHHAWKSKIEKNVFLTPNGHWRIRTQICHPLSLRFQSYRKIELEILHLSIGFLWISTNPKQEFYGPL